LFIAEGIKITEELINSNFTIENIYALKDWIDAHGQIKNITEVSEAELKKISNVETPQKVLAVVKQKNLSAIPALKNKITLLLDGMQDPGNLGAIIRTADWFGIENIIASNDTVDVYNSKVVQSTMGSIGRINIFYADLEEFLSINKNITAYGAMLNGENISAIKKPKECFIITGNESKGIRENIQPFIQKKISIPAFGNAESLNAAVATGIILFWLKV